jgi:hypothetical protein
MFWIDTTNHIQILCSENAEGHNDWRLPEKNELVVMQAHKKTGNWGEMDGQRIVDWLERRSDIDNFDWYWSSSVFTEGLDKGSKEYYWCIN